MLLTRLGIDRLWGQDPERAWQVARPVVPLAMRFLAPGYSYGRERIPRSGGAVLASNHFSAVDPPLIGVHSPRAIYYMAKIELLEVPIAGDILRWTGSFAVRRGESDRDSVRVALWLVREGHIVGMFMEGTRQKFGYPGPVHPGAVMIAMQEGVPVIPCGLDTFQWSLSNRRRCAVAFGEPITLGGLPTTGRGYREGAAVVEEAILKLWRQAAQAVADGFPETLPDGARRAAAPLLPPPRIRGARPWPEEPWAAGPLGPVFPGRR